MKVGRRALASSVALGVLLTVSLIAQAILLAHLLGWAMDRHGGPFPTTTVVLLAVAFAARAVLSGASEAVASSNGRRVTAELRRELFGSFEALGPIGIRDQKTGATALSATRGLRSLEPYFSRYLPAAVVAVLAPPLAFATLGIIDWPSAAIVLVLVASIPFFMIKLGRRAASESQRQWRRLSSLSGRTLELLRGLPSLRALGQVGRGRDEVAAASESVAQSVASTLRAAMLSTAALEFLAGVGVGLVAMLAGLRLLGGSMSVVAALTVILLAPEVFLPLRRAGAEFHASTEGRAAAETLFSMIDSAPPVASTPSAVPSSASRPTPIVGVDVEAVYPGATARALGPCSFSVNDGDHLVISGPSGSGKSTLLALLCGFLAPSAGSLQVGALTGREIRPDLVSPSVTYVPQTPHVFVGTVRENLTLGNPVDDEIILRTLEVVGLEALGSGRDGLDRVLAEQGRSISGGERQRLGLARAILQDRPVILLDEPTAHLDALSIGVLRSSLAPWLARRTVIEVTHRPGLLGETARHLGLARATDPSWT
jgi:ATP-binding cassette subfamily C protein CydCD